MDLTKKKKAFATASLLSNLALVEFGNPLFVSLQLLGFRSPYAHYDTCGSLWLVAIIGFSVRVSSPNQLNEWCSLPISQLIFGSFKGTSCTDFLSNDFRGRSSPICVSLSFLTHILYHILHLCQVFYFTFFILNWNSSCRQMRRSGAVCARTS